MLIAVATTEYRAPVSGRIVARCPLPPSEDLAAFLTAYRLRGRARLKLEAFIETKAGPAALFHATYVPRRPPPGPRNAGRKPAPNSQRPGGRGYLVCAGSADETSELSRGTKWFSRDPEK